jgi:hypothetical protein
MNRSVLILDRDEGGHSTSYEDTMAGLEFVIQKALGAARCGA